jgi:hypothetical protein
MMRVILLVVSIFASFSTYAIDDEELWARLKAIYRTLDGLQTQITAIPEGKQGVPGEKGERGIQGVTGERGARGAQGEQGVRGEPGIYTAGKGISIEGDVINVVRAAHKIGELYRGGIIFWLDETGEHGLIVSKSDINKGQGIQWRNGASGNKVTNARADGLGAGESNTNIIIAQQTIDQQTGNFAALLTVKYRVQEDGDTPCPSPDLLSAACYGAWYLPSAHELALIRKNLSQQGLMHFMPDYYWSSTEANATTAWMQNFATGELIANKKDSTLGQVRAVSRF